MNFLHYLLWKRVRSPRTWRSLKLPKGSNAASAQVARDHEVSVAAFVKATGGGMAACAHGVQQSGLSTSILHRSLRRSRQHRKPRPTGIFRSRLQGPRIEQHNVMPLLRRSSRHLRRRPWRTKLRLRRFTSKKMSLVEQQHQTDTALRGMAEKQQDSACAEKAC